MMCLCAGFVAAAAVCGAADFEVDFGTDGGRLEKALHSASHTPRLTPRPKPGQDEAELKPLGLYAARTHDWALVNSGQRMIDTHFIFPLLHLDAKDPKNYFFGPTDEQLRLTQGAGLKVFYRLGSSIEHSEDGHHWNIVVRPEDYAQYAEACAGIVRHYTKGWANGYTWDIPYWEIWNEPNNRHCWGDGSLPQADPKRRAEFCRFFAVVLKRLKSEFPELKFGGPALETIFWEWFDDLLAACVKEGVKPDFVSWHSYQGDADDLVAQPGRMRKYLDDRGYRDTGLIINEWHFLSKLGWKGVATWASPEDRRAAQSGPDAHNGINSAAYVLNVLSRWQDTPLDQAYYYGCRRDGNWGYLDRDLNRNKIYYALRFYGDTVNAEARAKAISHVKTASVLAVRSAGIKRILIADLEGEAPAFELQVAGVAPDAKATVELLDHTHDATKSETALAGGRMTLKKEFGGSTGWLITICDK